jgi:hypothetical protein
MFVEERHTPRWRPPDECHLVRITSTVSTDAELFSTFARDLSFPTYFGDNWDALNDMLRDLTWLEGEKPVVIMHDAVPFRDRLAVRKLYLRLMVQWIVWWNVHGTHRVHAVFRREHIDEVSRCVHDYEAVDELPLGHPRGF